MNKEEKKNLDKTANALLSVQLQESFDSLKNCYEIAKIQKDYLPKRMAKKINKAMVATSNAHTHLMLFKPEK